MSILSTQKMHQSINYYQKIFFKLLNKIKYGKITLISNDYSYIFSGAQSVNHEHVTLTIHNPKTFLAVFLKGSIGAAQSYIDGHWDTDNLAKLIKIFIKNESFYNKIETKTAKIFGMLRRLIARHAQNSIFHAKNNIRKHYDLGNEFFEHILDPSMMYSCAVYDNKSITLEEASINKLSIACQALELKADDHILEIGTGWGGFAFYAAKNYGCKITTTTISDKQYAYVQNKINQEGLQNQITLLNMDYRKLHGQFDKLVSIEMIEAVGHRHFTTFFNQCFNLLKQNGLFFLQAITINDHSYSQARKEIDFIKKYIFPGGCLPSFKIMYQLITQKNKFKMVAFKDIGLHYTKTLQEWQHRLSLNKNSILQQGFNEQFIRMWEYYFNYCIAGFDSRHISTIQCLWQKSS